MLWHGNECGQNKSNENFKTTIPIYIYMFMYTCMCVCVCVCVVCGNLRDYVWKQAAYVALVF